MSVIKSQRSNSAVHNMGVLFNNLSIFNPCYP